MLSGQVGSGRISDMQHVSRLLAVAVYGHGLSRQHPAGQDRDHPALLRDEVLAGTVDVCIAQDGELESKSSIERAEVLLETELARPIGR
jgi:hypothetical protein